MIDSSAPVLKKPRVAPALVLAGLSLVLSLFACGVAVVAIGPRDLLPVRSEPEPATAAQVEAVGQLTLPPGTVFLAGAYSNGLETRLSAKFRIPRATFDAFVSSAKFTAPPTPGLRAVTATHNVGGGNLWDPETAVSVSGIEEREPTSDGTYRSVLFDLDAPDTITVYLYASRG